MEITTRMEFDSGHRIPNHKSSCKNLHGHRYAIEVTLKGDIIDQENESDYGMVMDFKDAKEQYAKRLLSHGIMLLLFLSKILRSLIF